MAVVVSADRSMGFRSLLRQDEKHRPVDVVAEMRITNLAKCSGIDAVFVTVEKRAAISGC
jgi:hypothetical protein